MGYACPVCDVPQVDGRHLANHVAFTALTGEETHEAWLDEHVPGWGQLGEDDLADELGEYATEVDVETMFEGSGVDAPDPDRRATPSAGLDEDADRVLAEAVEYTRRMAEDPAEADSDEPDSTGDSSVDSTADETE